MTVMDDKQNRRYAGVLLHPTSLPGPSGVGDVGEPANRFVEFLARAGQSVWQMCPLGPTGFGDSPYASPSAFAGNPILISLDELVKHGLILPSEMADYPEFPTDYVDYEGVNQSKFGLLYHSATQFNERASVQTRNEFERFCQDQSFWLDDYALFIALKEAHDGRPWYEWARPLARREPDALRNVIKEQAPEIETVKVCQFWFFNQWKSLKKTANDRGIQIMGDAPIFLAHDSADVWSHPEMFFMDADGRPTVVAGVPPDYFSATGQLWGNPLYRWKEMKKDGYHWWKQRIKGMRELVDLIRLDHFRGFDAYWEVPGDEKTAQNGRWVQGPGEDFFEEVEKDLGHLPLIAEDLGLITEKVHNLRRRFHLPGMSVLQFAFGGDPFNIYLPHMIPEDSVAYTGTHDNDTTVGWYTTADENVRDHARRYLWCDGSNIHLDLIRAAWMSRAKMAIAPMQDLLGLGGEARMNKPGTAWGNWKWRVLENQVTDELADSLAYTTDLYGRGTPPPEDNSPVETDPRLNPDYAAKE